MPPSHARSRTVQVTLPEEAFLTRPWDSAEIGEELRMLFLIELVRERRLAYGKAAELAGVGIAEFVRAMGRRGVSPFDYDPGEITREVTG